MSLLDYLNEHTTDPHQREHVTLYLWDNPECFRLTAVPVPRELEHSDLRFDVDIPADLVRLGSFLERSSLDIAVAAAQIVEAAQGDAWGGDPD